MEEDWDKTIPYCQRETEFQAPTSDFASETNSTIGLHKETRPRLLTVVIGCIATVISLAVIMVISLALIIYCRRNHLDLLEEVHDYIDMGNIPARVSDCPNATRLRESLNFGNDATSDQRMPVNMIPTPVAVADTDVDAFGYVLPSSSASMSTMERSRIDNLDEYGYQTLSKREESAYTDLI
ncbi:uncharacterized protein LOC121406584 [Lytechinus variegatus]|uniref:uncharacterized protein LOC121406584 n=1 Tax=Lytechinus variegatus TaxID=7654 RepID=UPI001BB22827|nr:uncharacterized protein LOC121406584 [Lytechinus variegatus]